METHRVRVNYDVEPRKKNGKWEYTIGEALFIKQIPPFTRVIRSTKDVKTIPPDLPQFPDEIGTTLPGQIYERPSTLVNFLPDKAKELENIEDGIKLVHYSHLRPL